jgi:hypothetical protein
MARPLEVKVHNHGRFYDRDNDLINIDVQKQGKINEVKFEAIY